MASSSTPTTTVLDLTHEVQVQILKQLSPHDLCAIACTCRGLNEAVTQGLAAEQLWLRKCEELLGQGLVAVHKLAAVKGCNMVAFWRNLYRDAIYLDNVRWWEEGTHKLKTSVEQADRRLVEKTLKAEEEAALAAGSDNADGLGELRGQAVRAQAAQNAIDGELDARSLLNSQCQRSGHSALAVGSLLIITGGFLMHEKSQLDVLILHLDALRVSKPRVDGVAPATRFRHTSVEARNLQGTRLGSTVQLEVGEQALETGCVIALLGGYNTRGDKFGCSDVSVLWVSLDGSRVQWLSVRAEGTCPPCIYHHTTDLFDRGRRVVLYGGEGYRNSSSSGQAPPVIYVLNVASMEWQRVATITASQQHNPGHRTLHVSTIRLNPATCEEELVVVGGYRGNQLAEMAPFALNLTTFSWQRGQALEPHLSPPMQMPIPRQRAAGLKVGGKWLLVHGGAPAHGVSLDSMERLHLPSLTWRSRPVSYGEPSQKLSRIAAHTLQGGVAFGGFMPTVQGLMPVAKFDVLLFGCGPSHNNRPSKRSRGSHPVTHHPIATIPHVNSGGAGGSNDAYPPGVLPEVREVMFALGGGLTVQLWKDMRTGQLHAYRPHAVVEGQDNQLNLPAAAVVLGQQPAINAAAHAGGVVGEGSGSDGVDEEEEADGAISSTSFLGNYCVLM